MWMGFVKKSIMTKWTLGLSPPPAFEKRSNFYLFAECFPYGVNKSAFGFNQIWVGFCHLWGQQRYIFFLLSIGWVLSLIGGRRIHLGFVIYGWVLSHMGSAKIHLGFVKYGLGFVTYGVREDTLGICQIWLGFCHLWGEEGFSSVLSYMGGVCHGFCHIWAVLSSNNFLWTVGG